MTTSLTRFDSATEHTVSGARIVTREKAIEAFGVTYLHQGHFDRPIRELIGVHGLQTLPNVKGRLFSSQTDAVEYVRRLRKAAAQSEVLRCEAQISTGKARLIRALSFSQKIRSAPASIILAMTEQKLSEAREILLTGGDPKIDRLPGHLRFPSVVSINEPVYVVDYARFITQPMAVREERIEDRVAIPTRGGMFDAVVRYRVSSINGFLSYDHAGTDQTRMTKLADGVAVFLYREAAEKFIRRILKTVKSSIEKSDALLIAKPATVARALVEGRAA